MKNFPILSWNNFTPYKGYIKYLEELNNKVFSLFQYSEYFLTDYREIKKLIINNNQVDITQLSFHNFYQLPTKLRIKCGCTITREIAAGTVIISNAKEEGTIDQHPATSSILTDINNYFFQPMGWGSYYIPIFNQLKENNKFYSYYDFIYDNFAEENFGESIYFAFDTFFTRYFLNKDKQYLEDTVNSEISIGARDLLTNTNYIIDYNKKIWSAYLSNPVMGFTFYNETDINYGEEIVIDSIWNTTTFERSNIARYTIVSIDGTKHWPKQDNEPCISLEII